MLALVFFALFLVVPALVIAAFVRHANPTLPHPVISGAPVHAEIPGVVGAHLSGAYLDSTPQFATPAPVVDALTEDAAHEGVVRPFDHAGGPVYVHPSLTRMFAQHDAAAPAHVAPVAAVTPTPYKTASRKAQQDARARTATIRKQRNRAIAGIMRTLGVAITPDAWSRMCEISRTLDWDVRDDVATNAELFAHAYDAKFGVIARVHDEPQDMSGLTSWQRTRETRKQAGLTVRGTERQPVCGGLTSAGEACKRLARAGSRFCTDKHAENYARS